MAVHRSHKIKGKQSQKYSAMLMTTIWEIDKLLPLEPAIIRADWTKNIIYPGYKPCNVEQILVRQASL